LKNKKNNNQNNVNRQANVPTQKGESTEPGYMHLYEFGELNDMQKKVKAKKNDQ